MLTAHTKGARKGADFLYHVDPKQLKAAGVELVAFYLKRATVAQVKAYHDAGISVLMIHQRGYEGQLPNSAVIGREHGLEAKRQALALGYPTNLPIIFASMGDYDVTQKNIANSVAYWKAAKAAVAPFPCGAYGDWDLLQQIGGLSACNVQNAAKGWSFDWVLRKWRGIHPTAHMVQSPSVAFGSPSVVWPGTRIDWLDIVRTVTAWGPTAPKPVVVAPRPTLRYRLPNMTGVEVKRLQDQLRYWKWSTGPSDGKFGRMTQAGVKNMQRSLKVTVDGVYGPQTAGALQRFLNAMQALAGR